MEMCKRYAALFAYFLNARLIKGYYEKPKKVWQSYFDVAIKSMMRLLFTPEYEILGSSSFHYQILHPEVNLGDSKWAEAYSEPCQTSKIGNSAKMVDC